MTVAPPRNIEELACRLEIDRDKLISFSKKAPLLYRKITIRKEGKSPRIINPPHGVLKDLQGKLLHTTLSHMHCDDSLFARKGTSTVDAVIPHIAKPLLVTMDIKKFFPSVSSFQVYAALRNRGITNDVARIITRLTTYKQQLPQGAPTSVELGRLVLHPVVLEVKRVLNATETDYAFSMYVDDIIISGSLGLKRMIGIISKIFARHNFTLDKGKKLKIMLHMDGVQEALGIRIDRGIEPGEKIREKLAIAGNISKEDKGLRAYVSYLHERNQKYQKAMKSRD